MNSNQQMELLVISDYGSKEEIKKTNVSLQEIQKIMDDINWEHFHQVILSRSENDFIEVGGNLNEDGLACIFEKNNEQFVIDEAPTSVEQITEILISYFKGEEEFLRKYKFTGEADEKTRKEEESKKYNEWKINYEKELKKENKLKIRRFILVNLIVISIATLAYFGFTGELKFIGQKTEFTKARIVNTQMQHLGRGKYLQIVTYEFQYSDKKYSGKFRAGKGIGIQKVGGFVKVKFSISNPNRSLMKGVYKTKTNKN